MLMRFTFIWKDISSCLLLVQVFLMVFFGTVLIPTRLGGQLASLGLEEGPGRLYNACESPLKDRSAKV